MCVNRVKCVSEVMKLNVGEIQRREGHSEQGSREVSERNQKEGCQVQKGVSSWDECVAQCL